MPREDLKHLAENRPQRLHPQESATPTPEKSLAMAFLPESQGILRSQGALVPDGQPGDRQSPTGPQRQQEVPQHSRLNLPLLQGYPPTQRLLRTEAQTGR